MQTQTALSPPDDGNGGVVIAAGYPDDISDLGDRIAALSPSQAAQLIIYLRSMGVNPRNAWDLLFERYPYGLVD